MTFLLDAYRRVHLILPPESRRQVVFVLPFMVLNGLIEVAGVGGILPLMIAAADSEAPQRNRVVGWLYNQIGPDSYPQFLFILCLVALSLFTLVNIFGALTFWLSDRFAADARHVVSTRVLRCYLSRSYAWHLGQNNSELTKDVLSEVDAVSHEVIMNLALVVNYLITSFMIFMCLLYIDFVMASGTVIVLLLFYRTLLSSFRVRLKEVSDKRWKTNGDRYRAVHDALSVVKEVRAFSHRDFFSQRFEEPSRRYSDSMVTHHLMGQIPRYITETMAVAVVLGMLMYMVSQDNPTVLPMVTLYIMATWRLVPAVQRIYKCTIQIQFHLPALRAISEAIAQPIEQGWEIHGSSSPLEFSDAIEIQDGEFRYPNTSESTLKNINLRISKNSSLALVGKTGEGKTTLADVLAGHLELRKGHLKIDDQALTPANLARWRDNVGIVPQEIFLLDDSVKRNVALGLNESEIDDEQLHKAIQTAQISDFVEQELKDGYDTTLGERGITLSGGQRQRLGIARALYGDPQVLIFDEATSSLDKVTEKAVMTAIESLHGEKTLILIAHRLSTIKLCDQICLIEAGTIRAIGGFDELLESDPLFRDLVRLEYK